MKRAPASRLAAPPAGVVDVWCVPLGSDPSSLATLATPIDAGERRHAGRMRVAGAAWAAARGALRTILGGYLGLAPEHVRLAATANGKPRLAQPGGPEFSLSHTDGLALVAVASDRAVGVDVERENDRTDIGLVTREFLGATDAAAIELTAPERRRGAFFAAWARHEARLKLRGLGLGATPAEAAAEPRQPVLTRGLAPRPGYAAAVAAEGPQWTARLREFLPEPAGE